MRSAINVVFLLAAALVTALPLQHESRDLVDGLSNVVGTVGGAVSGIVDAAGNTVGQVVDGATGAVGAVGNTVGQTVGGAAGAVNAVGNTVGQVGQALGNVV